MEITYYPNGNIKSKYNYKRGEKHGLCVDYKSNGEIYSEHCFHFGEIEYRNGIYCDYYAGRKIKEKSIYVNNLKHGICIEYNRNGSKKTEIEYSEGKKNGVCIHYDKFGRKTDKLIYCMDKKHGLSFLFYKHDKQNSWYYHDRVQFELNYVNDVLSKSRTEYMLNGKIKSILIRGVEFVSFYSNKNIKHKILIVCDIVMQYHRNKYLSATNTKNYNFYKNKKILFY